MNKFCTNCGHPLKEGADVCLNCGVYVNKNKEKNYENISSDTKKTTNHKTYSMIVGIIFIILSFCVLIAGFQNSLNLEFPIFVYTIPGVLGITAGILLLLASSNKSFFLISGVMMFICFFINFISQLDISILGILCIIFGIINCIYAKN